MKSAVFAVVLAVAVAVVLVAPGSAHACRCASRPTPEAALREVDVVAAVTLVRVRRHSDRDEYVVTVTRAWKGATVGQRLSIWKTRSSCDAISGRWSGARLLFARYAVEPSGARWLTTGQCSQPDIPRDASLATITTIMDAAAAVR
jgi:hypothetical protein